LEANDLKEPTSQSETNITAVFWVIKNRWDSIMKKMAISEIPNSKVLRKLRQIGYLDIFYYVQIMEIICATFICDGGSAKHPPENQPVLRRA